MQSIKQTVSNLMKNSFWKSVSILVTGTTLAQLLGVMTTPIVSRLYEPSAFGEYAIIISTASIIQSIVNLGLNSAVMIPKSDEESSEVLITSFFTMSFLASIILIILLVSATFIRFINISMNYVFACLLVFGLIIINNSKALLNIYVNRKGLNRVLFYNSLISALTTLFVSIPLGIMKVGSFGLIIAVYIAGIISIIQMVYHANPFEKVTKLPNFKAIYKKYKKFIIYQYPSNFINNFTLQLPIQILSLKFGNDKMSTYFINEKVLGIPSRFIGVPINTIYFRTASEYYKKGKDLAQFTFSLITKTMLTALLPMLVIIFYGEKIFSWTLGDNWAEAGRLARFLIVQYVFMFCETCTSYCRVAIEKQKLNLIMSIIMVLVVSISLFLGIFIYGDFFSTIVFFTIGSTLYLIIDMTINFYSMGKYCVRYAVFALIYFLVCVLMWFLKY